jgi:glycosyltransferase involved in cell wall biosynthesis
MALVTIVVPTFNRAHIIIDTLISIKNQTLIDFECLIVDDFSTDNTQEVLLELVSADCRFIVLKNERRKGAPGARNTGLLRATGQFISFFDSDNIMYPNFLERMILLFQKDTHVDVVTAFSHVKDDSSQILDLFSWKTNGDIFEALIKGSSYVDTNSALIRHSRLDGFLWDENLPSYQEWDFHLSLSKLGLKYGMTWEILTAYYRRNVDTISSDKIRDAKGRIYIYMKWRNEFISIVGKKNIFRKIRSIPDWFDLLDDVNKQFNLIEINEYNRFKREINQFDTQSVITITKKALKYVFR